MRISDWSSDVCSSDLVRSARLQRWRLAFLLRALLHDPQRRHLSVLVFAPVYGAVRVGNLDAALVEDLLRSEEHTSELQSLLRITYAVFCLKKKNNTYHLHTKNNI